MKVNLPTACIEFINISSEILSWSMGDQSSLKFWNKQTFGRNTQTKTLNFNPGLTLIQLWTSSPTMQRFILFYPRTKNILISLRKFCWDNFNKVQNYKVPSIKGCPRCLMLLRAPLYVNTSCSFSIQISVTIVHTEFFMRDIKLFLLQLHHCQLSHAWRKLP